MSKLTIHKSGMKTQVTKDLSVKYCPFFQIHAVYFTDQSDCAFVNLMKIPMEHPSIEQDNTMMVALSSLHTLYSPDMNILNKDGEISVQYKGITAKIKEGSPDLTVDGVIFTMEKPPVQVSGELYVAVESLMTCAFHKIAVWQESYLAPGAFLGIGDNAGDLFETPEIIKDMIIQKNKKHGLLKLAYYYDKARRVTPYCLYVPMSYNPENPTRLAVWLHGAGGGAGDMRDWLRASDRFAGLADEYQTILLFPDGYAMGFYGGATPDLHPETCCEEEKQYLSLCEDEPLEILSRVCGEYNIDNKNIFLFGNSMGGAGSFYIGKEHPGIFRAIAPCGALTTQDIHSYDVTNLKDVPLLLVCGTENIGFDAVSGITNNLCEKGVKAEYLGVGGGIHATAWINALREIFAFFDKNAYI